MNRSETHNSTSYDQRTINSNHVTDNIVERTKTDAELRNERSILFMECCKQVFSDGLLTEEDKRINLVAIQSPEAKAAKRKTTEEEAMRVALEEEAKRKIVARL